MQQTMLLLEAAEAQIAPNPTLNTKALAPCQASQKRVTQAEAFGQSQTSPVDPQGGKAASWPGVGRRLTLPNQVLEPTFGCCRRDSKRRQACHRCERATDR